MTDAKSPTNQPGATGDTTPAQPQLLSATQEQFFYVDGITGVNLGPQVCKIMLSMEVAKNTHVKTATLIMPTTSFCAFVHNSIQVLSDQNLRDKMVADLQRSLAVFEQPQDGTSK